MANYGQYPDMVNRFKLSLHLRLRLKIVPPVWAAELAICQLLALQVQ